MDYHDLSIKVDDSGHLHAASDQGEVKGQVVINRKDIELDLQLIEADRTNEDLLKKVGGALYNALFGINLSKLFVRTNAVADQNGAGIRLRMTLEKPELAALPWELLYDESTNTFLANDPETALSRYIDLPLSREDIKPASLPLKILLVNSSPMDLMDLDACSEEVLIKQALEKHIESGLIELDIITKATVSEIEKHLDEKPYNIFHFIGHGIFKNDKGYIALMDENDRAQLLDDKSFANLFLGQRGLGLVILNACEGATTSTSRVFAGIAPRLVQRGIPAVIAMQYSIEDITAKLFADKFYRSLALALPVDEAVQSTRNYISIQVGQNKRDFATPVLYMRARDGMVLGIDTSLPPSAGAGLVSTVGIPVSLINHSASVTSRSESTIGEQVASVRKSDTASSLGSKAPAVKGERVAAIEKASVTINKAAPAISKPVLWKVIAVIIGALVIAAPVTYFILDSQTQQTSVNGHPSAPSDFSLSPGDERIILSWTTPARNGSSTITGYDIYRSASSVRPEEPEYVGKQSPFTDDNVTNGETYYYWVCAVNALGEGGTIGPLDATPSATLTTPGVPRNLKATPGDAQVTLSWDAPANNGGSEITGYNIYRSTSNIRPEKPTFMGKQSPYNDSTEITNGITYYYWLSAVNSNGPGDATTSVSAKPQATPTKPGVPLNLKATPGDAHIDLSWDAPANNGISQILSYRIYKRTTSGGESQIDTTSDRSYSDGGLINGQEYFYSITAVYEKGESDRSDEIQAIPFTHPTEPLNLSATPGENEIYLNWTPPARDGGRDITAYSIFAGTTSSGEVLLEKVGNSQSYTHKDAGLCTLYYYYVLAENEAGPGARSTETTGMISTGPSAPRDLYATPGINMVTLTWTTPSNDCGGPITGYYIYRSTNPGEWELVGNVGNELTFPDDDLNEGQTYGYIIRAVNIHGEGTSSDVVSATTLSRPSAPQNLYAFGDYGQITLNWSAPESNGGSPIIGYEIYRDSFGDDTSYEYVTTVYDRLTYVNDDLSYGLYYYQICAVNEVGKGPFSNTAEATAGGLN